MQEEGQKFSNNIYFFADAVTLNLQEQGKAQKVRR